MTFFPEGFDPRADVVGAFQLVELATPDGDIGLMPGADGIFTSRDGRTWTGSTLIGAAPPDDSPGGTAPEGGLTMTFIQDPDDDDLIRQIRALGADYMDGREVRFYVQPFTSPEELTAPTIDPILRATMIARLLTTGADGADDRSLGLSIEGPFEMRKRARRLTWNTVDHARLLGVTSNVSLTYMPRDNLREEKLFG